MAKKPLNPIGNCFESAAKQLLFGGDRNPPGTVLCHGICIANYPGQEGLVIGHAWLETEQDGTRKALDTTWGTCHDAAQYRKVLKPEYVVQYTEQEVRDNWKKFNMPGPWDPEIREVVVRS